MNNETCSAVSHLRLSFHFRWHWGQTGFETPSKSNEVKRKKVQHGIGNKYEEYAVLKHFRDRL